ncbi:hypothetical protein [Streptomyces sp. NPDC005046]
MFSRCRTAGAALASREGGRTREVVGAPRIRQDQPVPHGLLAGLAEFGGTLRIGVGEVQRVEADPVGIQAPYDGR